MLAMADITLALGRAVVISLQVQNVVNAESLSYLYSRYFSFESLFVHMERMNCGRCEWLVGSESSQYRWLQWMATKVLKSLIGQLYTVCMLESSYYVCNDFTNHIQRMCRSSAVNVVAICVGKGQSGTDPKRQTEVLEGSHVTRSSIAIISSACELRDTFHFQR